MGDAWRGEAISARGAQRWQAEPSRSCAMATAAAGVPSVRRIAALALVLVCRSAWPAAASVLAMPKPEDCPDCVFGEWLCPFACDASGEAWLLTTNFTLEVEGCVELTPVSEHVMQVEIDVLCLYSYQVALTCEEMTNYRFDGISFIDDMCVPQSSGASKLVREECQWVCRRNRWPTAQCRWYFDHEDHFTAGGGSLKRCWMERSCAGGQEKTTAACDVERGVGVDPSTLQDILNETQVVRDRLNQTVANLSDVNQDRKTLRSQVQLYRDSLTKQQEEQEKKEAANLALVIVAVVLGLLLLAALGAGWYACTNMSSKPAISSSVEGQVASDGGVMVVGRPVDASAGSSAGHSPPGNPTKGGKASPSCGDPQKEYNSPLRAAGQGKTGKAMPPPKAAW